ncbi:DUF1826 domain-containing protein [Falsiruegeria litorea]|uniref:DUF1826 domain-containing protein n=1 Tax=Falsiruegeria litorea TaxID=1280831 RepID=UPI001BFDAD24|nr:DUF1826 domain-containing protein [Falsiruegeria litorea]MBT8168368.1 DUF1826 domain-containing protein [Falsiruegeria litorea]
MNIAIAAPVTEQDHIAEFKSRRMTISTSPSILTDIYQEDVNLAVWQSTLPDNINQCIESLVHNKPNFKAIMTVSPQSVNEHLKASCEGISESNELCDHITLLVDMFCTLFDLKYAGLRLKLLDKPMCPRFHVDKVPCRLVTTFSGTATEWLPHSAVNRSKLGAGSQGKPDESSGIIEHPEMIEHLQAGDVALLKGESWHNNEGAGLVHRSPALSQAEHRLLLTLDFMS